MKPVRFIAIILGAYAGVFLGVAASNAQETIIGNREHWIKVKQSRGALTTEEAVTACAYMVEEIAGYPYRRVAFSEQQPGNYSERFVSLWFTVENKFGIREGYRIQCSFEPNESILATTQIYFASWVK